MSLSDDLDLRESLGTRSGQVVLRYSVTPVEADPGRRPRHRRPSASSAPRRLRQRRRAAARLHADRRSTAPTWDRTDSLDLTTWDPATLLSSDPEIRGTAPDAERGTLGERPGRGRPTCANGACP